MVYPILSDTGSENPEEKKISTSVMMLRRCNAVALRAQAELLSSYSVRVGKRKGEKCGQRFMFSSEHGEGVTASLFLVFL